MVLLFSSKRPHVCIGGLRFPLLLLPDFHFFRFCLLRFLGCLPFCQMILMKSVQGAFLSLPLNLDSYRQLFDPLYLDVFLNSLYMAGMTTVFCLLIGYPFAWALSGLGKQRQMLLIFLLIVPFWTNSLVRTYALKLLLATNGLINNALMGLGLIDEPLRMLYTEGAVIIGLVYLLLPFMILPLYSVFDDLRKELLMASHDLGAVSYTHLTLPTICSV